MRMREWLDFAALLVVAVASFIILTQTIVAAVSP